MSKKLSVSKQGPVLELLTFSVHVTELPHSGLVLTTATRRQFKELRHVGSILGRVNGGGKPMLCLVTDYLK